MKRNIAVATLFAVLAFSSSIAKADCSALPSYETFKGALTEARKQDNGGLNLDMWGTLVDRNGEVCAVAFTGEKADSQWPGSRLISAQKANTANAFSLKGLALSTANLYAPTQPGGSLFGLQESNPINQDAAFDGDAANFGHAKDPLVGKRIGGVNVFGGGLPLYNDKGEIVGGVGVSGDTSCADHNIAWRLRHGLKLDYVPAGVSSDKNDAIIYDIKADKSAGGFGHPACGSKEDSVAQNLPKTSKTSDKK